VSIHPGDHQPLHWWKETGTAGAEKWASEYLGVLQWGKAEDVTRRGKYYYTLTAETLDGLTDLRRTVRRWLRWVSACEASYTPASFHSPAVKARRLPDPERPPCDRSH